MSDLFASSAAPDTTDQPQSGFGEGLDMLARRVGGWPDTHRVYGIEVIGSMEADDPQIMLTGSPATWMPRAKRWKYEGAPLKAVVRLSEYRAALDQVPA